MTMADRSPGGPTASTDRLAALLDALELAPVRKEMLRQRWLDQVGWMGRQARRARRRYLAIRIPVVLGGVAIPGLIAILLSAGGKPSGRRHLSLDRATRVRDVLAFEAKLDPATFEVAGFESSRPKVTGPDDASRAQNRRIEIRLLRRAAAEGAAAPTVTDP